MSDWFILLGRVAIMLALGEIDIKSCVTQNETVCKFCSRFGGPVRDGVVFDRVRVLRGGASC